MSWITRILGVIATPITNLTGKYIDRKINQDAIKGKARLAKQSDATQITLTDSEWETVSKQLEADSWKDEYVTIIVTAPLVMILMGGLLIAYAGDPRLMEGTLAAIKALKELGVDMGQLMYAVVLAAVGLKLWRKA